MKFRSGTLTRVFLIFCAGLCVANGACSLSQLACNNGNCISSSYVCNLNDDCRDNSDEFGCGSCSSYQFRCFNGLCVDATKACNQIYECSDSSDESLCTYSCVTGSVRLVGTSSNRTRGYGRVEVCYDNTWGTICGDSGWNYNSAKVVCGQLGFGSPSSYNGIALYGQGTGQILLSGLSCYGYESTLFNCSHGNSVIGVTSCFHSQDASVTCSSSTSTPTTSDFGSSAFSIFIGVIVMMLVLIVITMAIVLAVYKAHARSSLCDTTATNVPTTVVTTTTQSSAAETPGYPSTYPGYPAPPPSYPPPHPSYSDPPPSYSEPTPSYPVPATDNSATGCPSASPPSYDGSCM